MMEIFTSKICKLKHHIRGLTIRPRRSFCRNCLCACRSYSSQRSSRYPQANSFRAHWHTLPNPVENGKKPFQNCSLYRTLWITQPAWTIVYFESFARLAGGEIGVAGTAERVRIFVRAVVVVPVEAVTSVAVVWSGVLLVTLLDETLHHFRQTRRARLEIIGAVKRFIASGNLFRRRISENARELALEEPLQSWLHNRLG